MPSEDQLLRRSWEAVLESVHPALEPLTPRSRFGALGRVCRRLVFRAVQPVIFSEHQVHMKLAGAIASVGTQVGRVESYSLIPDELDPGDVVDVQTDVGQLYLHRDDKVMTPFISERGVWEPEEAAFLRASLRPGYTLLDVGANVGYMSVLGGRSVGTTGRVIAIEPDSANVRLLRANLWRNGVPASVLPLAAFSHRGFAGFVRSDVNRGDHQLHERADAPLVPCSRLDDLLGPIHVDVAKIDTQGVDHEVLEGMTGLLSANPNMVVLSEFWLAGLEDRGIDPLGVLDRYNELGFALGLLTPDGGVRSAGPRDVIDACQAWEGLFVNIVLSANGRRSALAFTGHV
jgi:FkbM family methyltransferase